MQSKLSLLATTCFWVCTLLMWTTFNGCRENHNQVDLDQIDMDFSIIRYDQALSKLGSDWTEEDLRINYPFISTFYIQDILEIPLDDDTSFMQFVQNESIQELLNLSSSTFSESHSIEKGVGAIIQICKTLFSRSPYSGYIHICI